LKKLAIKQIFIMTSQGSDTRVRTQKSGGFFWVHPPKKPTPKKPTLLL